jgi:hypothetical protein
MARIFMGTGRAQIELSGGMKWAVDRVLGSASMRRLTDRMEAAAKRVHDKAAADWPVKSGDSKRALIYGVRIPDFSTIEAYIGFDASIASYHFFIKRPYPHNNKRAWVDLIRTPSRRLAKQLAVDLRSDLQAAVGGQ